MPRFRFIKALRGKKLAALSAVALTLLLAATAAAGTGKGGVFNLGVVNSVSGYVTTLTGSMAGRMLQVTNTSTATSASAIGANNKSASAAAVQATNSGGGPALGLTVNSGQAPMKVSAGAGKVANLDADKLDGKDSTGFYAAGSKVADSAHADRADSATNANHATNADNATNATDSSKLGGKLPSDYQSRVSSSCPVGSSIRRVGADGMVTCQPDRRSPYLRTIVVSPVGMPHENGYFLEKALAGITDNGVANRYLIHLEPGSYQLWNGPLQMKPYVDIQGSGQGSTVISCACASDGPDQGTVNGADNAELRFLTVENTRFTEDPEHVVAIFNDNASPRLVFVTATASGGSYNYGVYNNSSSPTIEHSKLKGDTNSIYHTGSGGPKVVNSQLDGEVDSGITCFNNYDQNFDAVSCP